MVKIVSQRPALTSLVPLLLSRGLTASVVATVDAALAAPQEEEQDDL